MSKGNLGKLPSRTFSFSFSLIAYILTSTHNGTILDDQPTDNEDEVGERYDVFLVKSFGENLAINLGLIVVFGLALVLSMLVLSHMLTGLSWDGA